MQLSFASVMPGYRVFQIQDMKGNTQMIDTEELAKELDLIVEKGDIDETMIRVHKLCEKMRNSDQYNELLTDLAEFFVAKKLGTEALEHLIEEKQINSGTRGEILVASMQAAKVLTSKLDRFEISKESTVTFTEKLSGKVDTLELSKVVAGTLLTLASLKLSAIEQFIAELEAADTPELLLEALSEQATIDLDACINFDISVIDNLDS